MKTPLDNSLIELSNHLGIEPRKPLLIAHRGGVISSNTPENSLAAIVLAGKRLYDIVELDVAEAKDCEPVLFHGLNGHLGVDCGVDAYVYEFNSEELVNIQYRDSNQCIARLSQAFKMCREHQLGVMLDIKGYGPHHSNEFFLHIAELLKRYDLCDASLTFSQDSLVYKYLRNAIRFALSEDELGLIRNGQVDISKGRWLFALPDEVSRKLVHTLQENDSLVIIAINRFRYPTHAHEKLARNDIEHLIKMNVDGLQIDSIYEGYVDEAIAEC